MNLEKTLRTPSETASEELDIDVTPVMNMFIILIPFLVSMAVFTHLAILDFSLPSNATNASNKSNGRVKLKLTILLRNSYSAITLGEEILDSIPNIKEDTYDYSKIDSLMSLYSTNEELGGKAVISVEDKVKFKSVIKIMDICKKNGFKDTGLASAAPEVK